MKVTLRRIGLALFVALGLFLIAFGFLYQSVNAMLPFHAAAVPIEMRPAMLPLYLGLMKLIGGTAVALGVLSIFIILGPLRRGASRWALPVVSLCIAMPIANAAYVAETLAAQSGAPTSWHLMGILLAILFAAILSFALGRDDGAAGAQT